MKVGPRRPLSPDADVIRALAGLLSETGLSEIEYAVGDHRIRVAKESAGRTVLVNGHANGEHANGAPHAGGGHANGAAHPPPEAVETSNSAAANATAPTSSILTTGPIRLTWNKMSSTAPIISEGNRPIR